MIDNSLFCEFLEAVKTMRSLQNEYDRSFRGKENKKTEELRVDRLILRIEREIRKEETEKKKYYEQSLF